MRFLRIAIMVALLLSAGSAQSANNDIKCKRFRLETIDGTRIEGKYGYFVGDSFVFRHLDDTRDSLAVSEISSLRRSRGHLGAAFGAMVASIGTVALFGGSLFNEEPLGSTIDVFGSSGVITASALLAYLLGLRAEVWEDVSLSLSGSSSSESETRYLVLTLRL